MKRREFIALAGSAVLGPITVRAQQPEKLVVGFLRMGPPPKIWVEAFQQGLREGEYVEGQNVVIQFRFTDGSVDQLQALAEELVRLKVDVILASAVPAVVAARKATTSVPIVYVGAVLPDEIGVVLSLRRPGANITGVAQNPADLSGKRLELLTEFIPKLRRVAVLWDRSNPSSPLQLEGAQVAVRALGMQFEPVPVLGLKELDAAFNSVRGADGLLVLDSPLFTTFRTQLAELAVTSRLPAIYGYREMVEVGGLMSYGAHVPDLYRRAATYVNKILKGAKPADLPIEQATTFRLVVNLKAAKSLGLVVPASLLGRADEVIE